MTGLMKEMIEYAKEKEFKLSKLSKTVSEGNKRASGEFYKDAGRYTAGHSGD
ncbi:hypothetical protein KHA80_00655 [Anaerobacillus sp. HL2]|nr:hypothetical protein KHA80_00655 [Anaerobacillus sp. HL2]